MKVLLGREHVPVVYVGGAALGDYSSNSRPLGFHEFVAVLQLGFVLIVRPTP